MQTALRILTHTPVWVFVLLAYLIWQGLQALQQRTQAVWRMLIVPLVFFGMGLSRLLLARDAALAPLLAWFAALTLFTVLGFFNGPRHLAVDRQKGTVTRPGSIGPLLRNVTVFALQYGVAVATAMKLEPHAAVTIIRPRHLRRQRRLFFGLGDRAVAGLPEFRWRPKYRELKSLLAH